MAKILGLVAVHILLRVVYVDAAAAPARVAFDAEGWDEQLAHPLEDQTAVLDDISMEA